MKPLSIMVVDDDGPTRQVLQLWLEVHGHKVVCASGGKEALNLLQVHPVELVITDVLMPGGSGIDLITKMKRNRPNIRVLAITGGGPEASSSSCLYRAHTAGAHALLLKPFKQDQLQTAIRYVMGLADDYHVATAAASETQATQRQVRVFKGLAEEAFAAPVSSRSREGP